MKLTKNLDKSKFQLQNRLLSKDYYLNSFFFLCFLTCFAFLIWHFGPSIRFYEWAPLVQAEKRLYLIAFLYLSWLLKFLLIDLSGPNAGNYRDPEIKKQLQLIEQRFRGAMHFLKKTSIKKQGKRICLKSLPWYLLLGTAQAGKTSLLANSQINFILQRQYPGENPTFLPPSENCDWWITREACVIDVPSNFNSTAWQFFLRLIKKNRGNHALDGIVIALPLPEILKNNDTGAYQKLMKELFQRLSTLQKIVKRPLPCHLVITKCDLLTGFKEFFAESGTDEITQAWGIEFPATHDKQIETVFVDRFDALIKKLNQQLIWRLHQERNASARPYIKDFPLQIERLKEISRDLLKKFDPLSTITIRGIYLTSACQPAPLDKTIEATPNGSLQIFKNISHESRSFFIKQFLTQGLITAKLPQTQKERWLHRFTYGASFGLITLATIFFAFDFHKGFKQTTHVQINLSQYQHTLIQIQNSEQQLYETIKLLDQLKNQTKNTTFKFDLAHFVAFFSHQAQEKTNIVYQQALQNILMPQIKFYFEEYLKLPVNKNADLLYAALKSYLMLSQKDLMQPPYVLNTFKKIVPLAKQEAIIRQHLFDHVDLALTMHRSPLNMDINLIDNTRKFLLALPRLKLSYIILKNIENNSLPIDLNLGDSEAVSAVFANPHISKKIPTMYTKTAFSIVLSEQTVLAAHDALLGNWVLGDTLADTKNTALLVPLTEQLRLAYMNNYIHRWEKIVTNLKITKPSNLVETATLIHYVVSNNSPFLQILQTLHDNTYFEPIKNLSPNLQQLGSLIEESEHPNTQLYQIFASLKNLQQYLQNIVTANREEKAAFEALSKRMLNQNSPDPIIQVRLVAENSPYPLRHWLNKIANLSSHFLLADASRYLDTSWQDHVIHFYENDIANRYPFNANANEEVVINKFINFFGDNGIVINFYNQFLQPFVDTESVEWRWKNLNNKKLPFSDKTLRQIQQAFHIHDTFFQNKNNKITIQFALQAYQLGDAIKQINWHFNNKNLIDQPHARHRTYKIAWPSSITEKGMAVQLVLANKKVLRRNFPGEWGLFKLISQSFETMLSKKVMLINVSASTQPAKYVLTTDGQFNPFLPLNLNHFALSSQLIVNKA